MQRLKGCCCDRAAEPQRIEGIFMAKRLATEYVFAKLQFKHHEMSRFLALMEEQQLNLQALVLDNGNQELHLRDEAGHEEIILIFEREREDYVCRLTCRVVELKLT